MKELLTKKNVFYNRNRRLQNHHERMLRKDSNGMRPLELLAEMQLSRGPNGMKPLDILAEMP